MKEVSVQQKGAKKCIQNFKNVSVTFVKTEHLVKCVADHLMLLGAYSIFGVEMQVVCGGF
jgi:predicted transcriptional regulator